MTNILVHFIATIIFLFILPPRASVFYFLFLGIIGAFIIATGFLKNKTPCRTNSAISIKDEYGSFLINLFSLALYGCLLRILAINIKVFSPEYSIYFIFFLMLIKNIAIRSPGFVIMNLRYSSVTLYDKVKILIRNFSQVSVIYCLILEKRLASESGILRSIAEMLVLLYVVNISMRLLVFKDMSLLDKILGQKLEKEGCSVNIFHNHRKN